MRYGFRKPSLSRSISAMTIGAAKRALMREIVPYYGKRGMGWTNPGKAAYNHLYSMTTVNPIDLILDKSEARHNSQKVSAATTHSLNNPKTKINILEDLGVATVGIVVVIEAILILSAFVIGLISMGWWSIPFLAGLGLIGFIVFKITPDNTKEDTTHIEEDTNTTPCEIPTPNMILRLYKGRNINLSRKFIFGMSKYPNMQTSFNSLVQKGYLEEWRKDSGLQMVRLTPLGKIALNKAIRHRFKDVLDYTDEELNQILAKTQTI